MWLLLKHSLLVVMWVQTRFFQLVLSVVTLLR